MGFSPKTTKWRKSSHKQKVHPKNAEMPDLFPIRVSDLQISENSEDSKEEKGQRTELSSFKGEAEASQDHETTKQVKRFIQRR